ncbi:MAG: C40 family peptidase [Trueperella sp.]|nr:C40 family peptidase [Trueperella sp.]
MKRQPGRHLVVDRRTPASRAITTSAFAMSAAMGMTASVAFGDTGASQEDAKAAEESLVTAVTVELTADAAAAWEMPTVSLEVSNARPEPARAAAPAAAPSFDYSTLAVADSSIVATARNFTGVPYVYGGSTPAGFDCSGFTSYVFALHGISLPRTSSGQRGAGVPVPASEAQPGDLVWWPGHVGIYTGNGRHIAAWQPGTTVHEGPVFGNPTYIRVG